MKRLILLICCLCAICFVFSACGENAPANVSYTFSVNVDEKTIEVGDVFQIYAAYGDKKLNYSSDNESVATVTENGKVNAINSGVAYITISVEGSNETYICEITVVQPQYIVSFIDEGSYKVFVGATKSLKVKAFRDGQEYSDTFIFTVNSTNASIETINNGCVFKATEAGTYEVKATSGKGAVATIIITVINE